MKWDLRWTDSRCDELDALRQLLNEVQTINRGSHVLQRIEKCIELAEKLDKTDYMEGRPSFAFFLNELCINERRVAAPSASSEEKK